MQRLLFHTFGPPRRRVLGGIAVLVCVMVLGPVATASPQEPPGWGPSRPDAVGQRARDRVAARRPGMQPADSPASSTQPPAPTSMEFEREEGYDGEGVVQASFDEPPSLELIFADEVVEDLPMGEVIIDEPEVLADNHSFCDCPECMAGANSLSGHFLYDLLGDLNGCGWWVTTDYMLWSFDGMDLPALVTTSTNGTPPATTGVLGLPNTSTLFGGTVADDFRSGGRIKVGMWMDPTRQMSWEFSYLGFDSDAQTLSFNSATTPRLARPVLDTGSGTESALLIAHNAFLSGSTTIDASIQLQAFDVIRRQNWWNDGVFNVDLLLGYKHGDLDEFLRIDDSSSYNVAQGPVLAGTNINRFDQFEVENSFDGFLIGLDRRHVWRGWMIGYTGKLSLGANQARVRIDGRTTTTVPSGGGTSTATGGLLAQSSNIGEFRQDQFAVIPEFEFLVRRQVTDRVRLHAGYSLLYWSAATRVGDTVGRQVSQFPPEPISGAGQPTFTWTDNGFFAHGFQAGLDYKF